MKKMSKQERIERIDTLIPKAMRAADKEVRGLSEEVRSKVWDRVFHEKMNELAAKKRLRAL